MPENDDRSSLSRPAAYEPDIADPVELRAHRKRRLALAYRVFARWAGFPRGWTHLARDQRVPNLLLARGVTVCRSGHDNRGPVLVRQTAQT